MRIFPKIQEIIQILSCCVPFNNFIRRDMSKYDAVYFVGDNQANNRVRVDSSRTSNRGAFLGSFAALHETVKRVNQLDQKYKIIQSNQLLF